MWKYKNGRDISCTEKIKILNENLEELKEMLEDCLDDAVLIGCSEQEIKEIFINLVKSIQSQY